VFWLLTMMTVQCADVKSEWTLWSFDFFFPRPKSSHVKGSSTIWYSTTPLKVVKTRQLCAWLKAWHQPVRQALRRYEWPYESKNDDFFLSIFCNANKNANAAMYEKDFAKNSNVYSGSLSFILRSFRRSRQGILRLPQHAPPVGSRNPPT
jgi:hypothetical protein